MDKISEIFLEGGLLNRLPTQTVENSCQVVLQQAIDAVKDEGQYQAIKYLFETIGLYPAAAQDESPMQESLARTLLQLLGLPEVAPEEQDRKEKSQPSIP